jgi:hypothetical protein
MGSTRVARREPELTDDGSDANSDFLVEVEE